MEIESVPLSDFSTPKLIMNNKNRTKIRKESPKCLLSQRGNQRVTAYLEHKENITYKNV